MKTKIIVRKIDIGKDSPIWYYGQETIAEIEHLNRKILVKAPDSVRIIDNSGKNLKNLKAFKALQTLGLTNDSDLYAHNDKVFFDYFGEFDFVYINTINGAEESLSNDGNCSYSDAIKYAESTILKDKFWIDTDKPISKVTSVGVSENWIRYFVNEETFTPPQREK